MASLPTQSDQVPARHVHEPHGAWEHDPLPVVETLRGKNILVTGATGFLGKVFVSMLLHEVPEIGRLYLLVRPRTNETAAERVQRELIDSPAFDKLRDRYSDGLQEWIEERIEAVPGDVTHDNLGLSLDDANALAAKLDLIINSAGLTDFNPSLDQAININTLGTRTVLEFAKLAGGTKMQHISTCYVAGTRDGKIEETELPYNWIPDDSLDTDVFDVEQEVTDCHSLVRQIDERASDQKQRIHFRTRARDRMERENRDHSDPEEFEKVVANERRRWRTNQLKEVGIERAKSWGWTNIYTYSKSLGEQLLTHHRENVELAILRPAIIESASEYPVPGWNEGINTCGPLTYLTGEGARFYPTRDGLRLDVVPVDYVSRSMILVAVAMLRDEHKLIYQCSSSDRNPISMDRIIELSTLWHRRRFRTRTSGSKWFNVLMQNVETVPVSQARYEWSGAPIWRKTAGGLAKLLDTVRTRPGTPSQRAVDSVRSSMRKVEKVALTLEKVIEIFMPFIYDNQYIFKAEHLRELEDRLRPEERRFAFDIEAIDWREYWLEVQMPGLNRWVYPKLRAKLSEERRLPHTYDDLIELFEAAARNHADRPALQLIRNDQIERYTYRELGIFAERAAHRLQELGLTPGQPVMLMSENRPQWGMTYLGILKAGGTCVPVDPELYAHDVWNVVDSCKPFALITSERVRQRLDEELEAANALETSPVTAHRQTMKHLDLQMLLSDDVALSLPSDAVEPSEAAANIPQDSAAFPRVSTQSILSASGASALVAARQQHHDVASLIYTSGTTGHPKGVMLTHHNFTSLLQALNRTFKVDDRDGFLSVLPLHHTFEFACGLLLPLSRGATISYIDELNPENLNRAFDSTPITVMIGVPALWQVFHRRIKNEVRSGGIARRQAFEVLTGLNRFLRSTFNVNIGPVVFSPVFQRFGGKVRYFISGGASLPPSVLNTFQGLGFSLLEGYGLTETSPVLTVNRPGDMRAGSVGTALPGVTIDIVNPDADGVGEIRAQGPNIMLGYHDDPERTKAVLRDGWFYTGDLGRLDRKKRLYIVGRKKEVIVASSGKNVYPDELEDLFGKHWAIEELAVVGLPDGSGSERVASLVKPDLDGNEGSTLESLKHEIRRHVEVENTRLPFYQRIKVLRFTDEALPRTATRKVKRDLVRARLLEVDSTRPAHAIVHDKANTWLFEMMADVGTTAAEAISFDDQLIGDLGFDSLMLTELATRIEDHTGIDIDMEAIVSSTTVRDILEQSGGSVGQPLPESSGVVDAVLVEETFSSPFVPTLPGVEETSLVPSLWVDKERRELPPMIADAGNKFLDWAQKAAYEKGFKVKVSGKANIPYNEKLIVVANHTSHLDMGLIKYALWEHTPQLSAVAASDYFFSSPAKKAYFQNFSNLIPVERSGSLEESLASASEALEQGRQLLIFPEGTRSTSGDMQPFRRGIGYLAVRHRATILPVYVGGTYRSLRKGHLIPRSRRLEVRIGEPLTPAWIDERTAGLKRGEAYRVTSEFARDAVIALKNKRRFLSETAAPTGNPMLANLITFLEGRFVPNSVDEPVSYYFTLEDSEDGRWSLLVEPDKATFTRGKPAGGRADCVLKCEPDMFRRIVEEHYTPSFEEFMNGTVKSNDPQLLIKFQAVFAL